MLIYLYLLLLLFALVFLVLGFVADNPILSITGASFLFLLGYVLMGVDTGVGDPPGIEFPSGHTEVNISPGTVVTTTNYVTLSNRTFGFFLEFVSFAAIFLTLLDMWRAKQ